MAVFTPVSSTDLSHWLSHYTVGPVQAQVPIASGIENTNYFVDTSQGRYVLTLFEKLQTQELPYYLHLMDHLARHGLPCPQPLADNQGHLFSTLCGKPATLVTRLRGQSRMDPEPAHCQAMGALVAQLHLGAANYPGQHPNPRGPAWWHATGRLIHSFLNPYQQDMLRHELAFQALHRFDELPRGPIHADLFRDNVLFDQDRVGGVIDFYFAGTDSWLYDLAIVANDWCMRPDAQLDPERTLALLQTYQAQRPLTAAEKAAWPVMLRAAALRFWLSRSHDKFLPRAGEMVHPHDPTWFERILKNHMQTQPSWPL